MLRDRKNDELMASGVTIVDPGDHLDSARRRGGAGHGASIRACTSRDGRGSARAARFTPASGSSTRRIGDRVVINNFCVIRQSRSRRGAQVGPFAQIRPASESAEDAHVGNFVELKNTTLGRGSKANHLAYLGDATIGEKVNVGAGTITCNYDGVAKHPTIIEDGAFIGSDSQLIAPVRIGKNAYVAAGSSITEDVPPESLAIARGRQVNKPGWIARAKRKKRRD